MLEITNDDPSVGVVAGDYLSILMVLPNQDTRNHLAITDTILHH